jgi:hypothetical protein
VLEGELSRLKSELAPEIALRTDDPARAAEVLRGWDLTVVEADDGLTARLRSGDDADQESAELNRALIEAGLSVFAIGPRARSLEGIYRGSRSLSNANRRSSDDRRPVRRGPQAEPVAGRLAGRGRPEPDRRLPVLQPAARQGKPQPWEMWTQSSTGIWAFFMLPMSVTALTALVAHMEHGPRAWDHLRALPVARWKLYAAKAICVMAVVAAMSLLNLF